ncbi:transporter substrate-binding domain-containing protein [Microbacterium sp. G2-8]|uniref:transporter substrate-binding domain-containing protein n=1 Tax=Microbacterium sp. G2-8 TaxID=2842454 RepID=UPI001C8963E9|nr:transporter substrate-binding domain-containing protein [Microbacterium sp. G2-8]
MVRHRTHATAALLCATVTGLTGCSGGFPADAQGTLDRATDGTIRVGISENPPWTRVGPDAAVTGTEAELVTAYADAIDTTIEWVPGAESVLAEKMRNDDLDLIVAGLTDTNPWSSEIAPTRPYETTTDEYGTTRKMVIGVRPGENALQLSLERFLADRAGEI